MVLSCTRYKSKQVRVASKGRGNVRVGDGRICSTYDDQKLPQEEYTNIYIAGNISELYNY